jgi:hypothetical protein
LFEGFFDEFVEAILLGFRVSVVEEAHEVVAALG